MTRKNAKILYRELKGVLSHLDVDVSFVTLCRGYHQIHICSINGFISSPVFSYVDEFLRRFGKDWLDVHISKNHNLVITLS